MTISAPFPWFGGKRKVAAEVWSRFGIVNNYVEPFFGSGAMLLGRPQPFSGNETVNDLDGYVSNFWRALKAEPDAVAEYADNPVNENDLHARHVWLVKQQDVLCAHLDGDPDWYDPKIAGWWVWGIACWIGGGFCSGQGPWWTNDAGQLVHLGDGRGVNRKHVHLGGVHDGESPSRLVPWFRALAKRLRNVRVCSGDWSRICGPSATFKHGLTGVFLDPPYSDKAVRRERIYRVDDLQIAHSVREWCIENAGNPLLRIALCGYDVEHEMPESWSRHAWNAGPGYRTIGKKRSENGSRETIWFSPSCMAKSQIELFNVMP